VKTFSVIRDVLGSDVVEIDVANPETVGGLFDALLRQYGQPFKDKIWDPNTGEMAPFLVTLNEAILRTTSDMDQEIKDGDEIALIFPIGGG
jgi:MoaD family protein